MYSHIQKFLAMVFFLLFSVTPLVSFAASTIIPCGFDSDANGIVANIYDTNGVITTKEECDFDDVITLAQNVINFLIFDIATPIAAVMFAYAGFLMLTNKGNESQITQAKEIFTNVLIGFVVALGAWLLVNYVLVFFLGTGSSFNLLKP